MDKKTEDNIEQQSGKAKELLYKETKKKCNLSKKAGAVRLASGTVFNGGKSAGMVRKTKPKKQGLGDKLSGKKSSEDNLNLGRVGKGVAVGGGLAGLGYLGATSN